MKYSDFLESYREIIKSSCLLLKSNCFACFVVGEIRDKKGNYVCFVPDTIRAFMDCGMNYYNDFVYIENGLNTAAMRAKRQFNSARKAVKTHQNIIVFVRGDPKKATNKILDRDDV